MSKLSDFYKLKPKFGAYANEEQKQKMDDMEKSLIKEEILPDLQKASKPVLEEVQRPIRLVLDYIPGEDPKISFADDSTPTQVSEPVFKPELLLTHKLDWSPFEYGFTIDKKYHEQIFKLVGGYIQKGKGVEVKVVIDDIEFKAKITNANVKKRPEDIIRLLYHGKTNTPGQYLQGKFPDAYLYLKEKKDKFGGRKQIELPDNLKADLRLWTTESSQKYRMECTTLGAKSKN